MKKNFENLILFFMATTLFLSGCVASNPQSKRKSLSSSVKSTSTTGTTTSPTFGSEDYLYWYTSEKINGTITINKNSESVVYLRGQTIHDFLMSKDSSGVPYYQNGKVFCLVANQSGIFKQLRLRAVPISVTNYNTNSLERLLRVDVPSSTENNSSCGVATTIDGISTTNIDGKSNAQASYSLAGVCSSNDGCFASGYATSTSLKLFQSDVANLQMNQISTSKIAINNLSLKIDLQSSSNSSSGSCTNSSCEAKGFNCCIEGQCVMDATEKANAQASFPAEYIQAKKDYLLNPMSFINYPNIYNICSNIAHNPTPTPIPGNTPQSEAEKRVAQYLTDFTCTNKYETTSSATSCTPSSILGYEATKLKLAKACGCPSSFTTWSDSQAKCPNWGIKAVYKSSVQTNANIIDFYCYTPLPENPIGPITNLNVNVSSRSAPHRFYAESTIIKTQEGIEFFYQDPAGKTSPENGSFNINSILGTMKTDLSQTNPAKTVTVEIGKTYILSATSGYFTPCSQCAKDSWYQSFTPHPATTGGSGLRATGFSTARDNYGGNTSLANYEDTKFGRACYVPVTMIPWSHKKNSDVKTQRINRLETQAAFFVNGYQKDWYGFNKGALIGSFDGVTWFAVGSSRRITATSTKLFLAINGAFLDLADRTDTIVNIIPDISSNIASDYDFDSSIAVNDPKQNTAGSCQQYHQCNTDTDCITQLGWEYVCADVSQVRSKWPVYDTDGNELKDQEIIGTIFEILQNTATSGDNSKRCVYRGAGAPCIKKFTTQNGKFNQKILTCAPNFYCAGLAFNKFNDQIVRSPKEFDDILFGMDTNVLGRPLNYVTASKNLTDVIRTNIKYNGALNTLGLTPTEVDDMGMCQPGKALPIDAATTINPAYAEYTHSNYDTKKRTDYISQISSCNSSINALNRIRTCPAIGDDLNYLAYDSIDNDEFKKLQNSCGAESKNSSNISAFMGIEGLSLSTQKNISQPILAQDACFRRAGSTCFTDLDCSPNKMHEESVGSLALSYFGGTEAEQSYWKESLICGQGKAVPQLGAADYYDYKLSENRCCREIGKDFTMYTSGPSSIVPENMGTNVNLKTSALSVANPTLNYRYSRYTHSKTAISTPLAIPEVTETTDPNKDQWKVINETGTKTCCGGGWIRKFADGTHDWKVKNRLNIDVTNFSCLNFRSPLPNPDYPNSPGFASDYIVLASYQKEYDKFCKLPGEKGCFQIPFLESSIDGFALYPPKAYLPNDPNVSFIKADDDVTIGGWETAAPYNTMPLYSPLPATSYTRLQTGPDGDLASGNYTFRLNSDVPYQPTAFSFAPLPIDLFPFESGEKQPLTIFMDKLTDYGVSMYLPAYIPYNGTVPAAATSTILPTVSAVYIKYFYDNNRIEVVNITDKRELNVTTCDNITKYTSTSGQPVDSFAAGDFEKWCISANPNTQNRPVLNFKAYTGAAATRQWKYASIIIDFKPLEIHKGTTVTTPGNLYYYLTKLARLELIGIPQITYEPIYCNNNHNNLVPGIFDFGTTPSPVTRLNINSYTQAYTKFDPILNYNEEDTKYLESNGYGNYTKRFTYQDKLAHAAVFSSKDFTCCTPLGKETATATKCCSGTATNDGGKLYCKLPTGTDLNVYFNKFVSSEGVGANEPNGGLLLDDTDEETSDFNAFTGEPKLRASTNQKLESLGKKYCQSGIIGNGGAFGKFESEPYSGFETVNGQEIDFPISIVDSVLDSAEGNLAGKFAFDSGFRWDHHIYCK